MGRRWLLFVCSIVAFACSEATQAPVDEDEPLVTIDSIELAFHRMHDDVWALPEITGPSEIRGKRANHEGSVLIARSGEALLAIAGWSFDGAFLGVTQAARDPDSSESDVLIFDATSTDPRVIAGATAARFSPARRELAFARDGEVLLFDLETAAERPLGGNLATPCSWSPTGDRLAVRGGFPDGESTALGLFVVDVASGEATRIEAGRPETVDLGGQSCVQWSPHLDVFAFPSNALTPDVDSTVHVVNVDGSELRALPGDDFGYGVRRLWWTPTGDRIVTASWTFDTIYTTDNFIEQIGLDGSASVVAKGATDYAVGLDARVAIVEQIPEGDLFTATWTIRVEDWRSAPEGAPTTDTEPSWRPI